jgi:uncharacterized protein (TIGR03437 family)
MLIRFGGLFVKQAFGLSRSGAVARLALAVALSLAAALAARAQTTSPTPDSVFFQIANTASVQALVPAASPSPTPTPANTIRDSYAQDVSGDGRFVVMESTGDIATNRSDARNNLDGNVEIFLFDYAQRRIYQITNTKNAVKDVNVSPQLFSNVEVSVRNIRPMISHDGRFIVFASNAYSDAAPALTPKDFDGEANETALKADGNMEIFIYAVPAVAAADLSSGAEVAEVNLASGAMTRVTSTPASVLPTAGQAATSTTPAVAPNVADDNREAQLNDDGSRVIFVSTGNLANVGGLSNADRSPEVFIWLRTGATFVQVTNTQPTLSNVSQNPNINGDGTVIAFSSSYDLTSSETPANRGNQELYVAGFNGTAVTGLRPVTQTPPGTAAVVNVFSPGRRLSRNGQFLAFESRANFNTGGTVNGALADTIGTFLVRLSDTSFTLVVNRVPTGQLGDVLRFPTFTGDSSTILFASTLNLRATTGEALAENSTDGINPGTATARTTQVFAVGVPAAGQSPANYRRLTHLNAAFGGVQPFASDTVRRSAFSLAGIEIGGGNPDLGAEGYYLIVPNVTSEATTPAPTFFTGASERPVVAASPTPTPPAVTGLAPGMLGIVRSTLALASSTAQVSTNNADEATRRPPLPVELNGVTVGIGGVAAGLYFISPGQINFVVPPGNVATPTSFAFVVNNNGAAIRSTITLNPSQPDIFTSTNGPGGRAAVLNAANMTGEPFSVTTGTAPTELIIMLTGVRNATVSQVTVRIKDTDITGAPANATAPGIVSVGRSRTSGFDQIVVRLPPSLAGAGDSPIIVTVNATGGPYTSRPADTAPRITIQ